MLDLYTERRQRNHHTGVGFWTLREAKGTITQVLDLDTERRQRNDHTGIGLGH